MGKFDNKIEFSKICQDLNRCFGGYEVLYDEDWDESIADNIYSAKRNEEPDWSEIDEILTECSDEVSDKIDEYGWSRGSSIRNYAEDVYYDRAEELLWRNWSICVTYNLCKYARRKLERNYIYEEMYEKIQEIVDEADSDSWMSDLVKEFDEWYEKWISDFEIKPIEVPEFADLL